MTSKQNNYSDTISTNIHRLCGEYITQELQALTADIQSRFGKLTDPAYQTKKSELVREAWAKMSAKYQADYARKNLVYKGACGLFVPWNVVKQKLDNILQQDRNKQLF